MNTLPNRLRVALNAAGVAVDGVSIGSPNDKSTWLVSPSVLQGPAQPLIDAFNPFDPALDTADADAEVRDLLDNQRISSAIVWAVIDQLAPPATKAKFAIARQKVIDAYKAQPWKP